MYRLAIVLLEKRLKKRTGRAFMQQQTICSTAFINIILNNNRKQVKFVAFKIDIKFKKMYYYFEGLLWNEGRYRNGQK